LGLPASGSIGSSLGSQDVKTENEAIKNDSKRNLIGFIMDV